MSHSTLIPKFSSRNKIIVFYFNICSLTYKVQEIIAVIKLYKCAGPFQHIWILPVATDIIMLHLEQICDWNSN